MHIFTAAGISFSTKPVSKSPVSSAASRFKGRCRPEGSHDVRAAASQSNQTITTRWIDVGSGRDFGVQSDGKPFQSMETRDLVLIRPFMDLILDAKPPN